MKKSCGCCPDKIFLTDEVCGNFTIGCDDSQIVWQSVSSLGGSPDFLTPVQGGTVTVFFDRGCGDLTVNVYKNTVLVSTFPVPDNPQSSTGNTRSRTILSDFDTVEIVCGETGDTGAFCTGKFCITAHFCLR
ncbi:DUF3992 domain-containing protein [Bacillus alveayuensis]|uniref:DUF3992 domain-containing protein n=1 Tax=Aeribacillus alveayuensis TaxID=279215 RepID=UPI0005D0F180|nr:S-Ena type endospore appendage [Bacillus alveayuensis]